MADGKGTAVKTKSFISKENAQNRPEPIQWGQGDFGRFCVSGANRQLGSKKEVPAVSPVCRAISRENGRLETDAHIFTEGGDDRGGYENRLFCGENWRYDFRCQRNARRERKAHAGGDCKGSDSVSVHLVFLFSKLLPLCSPQRLQARRIRDLCPCKGDEALLDRIQLFFL